MYNDVMQAESMTSGTNAEGDPDALIATGDGILISPQEVLALRALDQIGAALQEQGISLDELIESGREERSKIIKEKYNLPEEG
jgi:hypothetical protein